MDDVGGLRKPPPGRVTSQRTFMPGVFEHVRLCKRKQYATATLPGSNVSVYNDVTLHKNYTHLQIDVE